MLVVISAGAAAAIETGTVTSFWRGSWWSLSLVTTVGFIGAPPTTDAGAALSVVLMVVGFVRLALVSASMAALFVRDEERPRQAREEEAENASLAMLRSVENRLASIERRLAERSPDSDVAIRASIDDGGRPGGRPDE
ncbi:MAG: potassium channel family protein [Cellulomonas sp.]